MRHGPPPGIGAQVDEINYLVMENKRLAASIAAMRRDRAMADEEIRRLKAHIRSVETESDIQIRVLLDKISRMELGLKAGDSVKKDLQQAHKDAQSLVAARHELKLKVQQATEELDKWPTDIKRIPELLSKLDSMKMEHQRLRSAFEYEKGMNLDLLEHMQEKEKSLLSMDREVEFLRAEILAVQNRVQAPNGDAHLSRDVQYPCMYQSKDPYIDPYRRTAMEGNSPL
ncbi:hypothetical protein SOVF_174640 isoform A [Spinacia oleracea]|uniref:Protein FLX-like 2 n=1 Tax=Spinacia oleracea TaxID=3562 RepID=A0A9R0JI35_SPIOL|nr:protein FLX-like 2 [Spinacia oleracea]KNA07134.1 hypothetical protein SOVF_174640 isoform A [Spinacia oleracea]